MTRISLCGSTPRLIVVLLLVFVSLAQGFVIPHPSSSTAARAPTSKTSSRLYVFEFPNILEALTGKSNNQETIAQRESLKASLLAVCRSPTATKQQQRTMIQDIIQDLQQVTPTPAAASSPLLQKQWDLVWTTEKEINFFLDVGFSNRIGQTIAGTRLDNTIDFVRGGGGFYVTGQLTVPDLEGRRTEFAFTTATLDLGSRWGRYEFPPVGAGWFDTVYLDDTLRVDVNSRDDILICTPSVVSS